jgi:small subunit ribosomal protein S17
MADNENDPASMENTAAESSGPSRPFRKVREGVVSSAAMQKSIVVTVTEKTRHPKYGKTVLRTKKLHAHDEGDLARVGDQVRVMETRPLSKTKRWRLVEVLERAR